MDRILNINKDLEKEFRSKANRKFLSKVNNWLENYKGIENPYYEIYKDRFLLPKLIRQYYKKEVFTEEKVIKGMIIEHGRNFEDGFSGIRVKNINYTNKFIIEIRDGERGQLFLSTYIGLPVIEDLIIDSFYIKRGNCYE